MSVNLSLTQSFRFGKISREEYLAELAERNAEWAKLSPVQQLAALDRRLGVGVGAKRQRTKLSALLNPVTPAVQEVVPAPGVTTEFEDYTTPKKKFKKGNKKHAVPSDTK